MSKGRIVIVTGIPATGKSTVSSILAEDTDFAKSVHMHTDDFYHLIKKGRILPHLPESNQQNKVVIEAFLEATKVFAMNDYEVIVDGIIGPWFIEPWIRLANDDYEVHYIILRASKEETLIRARNRSKLDEQTNIELVESMWDQFSNLDKYESHVINTTNQTINQTVISVRKCINDKNRLLQQKTL